MNIDVSAKISVLSTFSKDELLRVWKESVSTSPPPAKLRRVLLADILAYRLQEKEFGGLSLSAKRALQEFSKRNGAKSSSVRQPSIETGTRLVRSYKGRVHEVHISGGWYEYEGVQFRSLSAIAKKITGTHCSGPSFFGLTGKA